MQFLRIFPIFSAVFLILTIGLSDDARAADVSVNAELSRPEVNAGDMAELQVRVTGADGAKVPQEIPVEGLQIRLTGQSTQVQMVNFKVSSSAVYSYIVMPLRTGRFTIPSISVQTDTGTMQTRPLNFSVVDSGSSQAPASTAAVAPSLPQPGMPGFQRPRAQARHNARADSDHLAFGEIISPQKRLYAGEMMPVEIRYYFDARYPVQVRGKVDFGSEGLLVERFPDPKESREERDGITYNVLTYHTLISAVKPGVIDIPPAKLESQIQMPGGAPPGFDDPVFQQLLGGQNPFTQARDVTVKTAPLHLEVLPLPKEGRPASFAGAVGQFDIDAMVANPKPAPGDPAVLSIKIGGKGNFSAMGAPILTGTEGWRTYPPSDKFESSGELPNAGVKSFDFTLIAQDQRTNSPGSEFSYFDPLTAKYETLTTKSLPLSASPASVSPAAASQAASQSTPQQGKSPAPGMTPNSHDEDSVSTMTSRSWKTPVERSEFLIATLGMFLATAALAGILKVRNLHAAQGSATARRRRLSELLVSLNSETLDASGSYDAALEYLELLGTLESDALRDEITQRRDLLKYGVGGSVALARDERTKLVNKLRLLFPLKS